MCKLSCVDLAKSCTSVQSVVNDINVILRCAESIKVYAIEIVLAEMSNDKLYFNIYRGKIGKKTKLMRKDSLQIEY